MIAEGVIIIGGLLAGGVAATGASMFGAYAMTDLTRPENAKSVYDEHHDEDHHYEEEYHDDDQVAMSQGEFDPNMQVNTAEVATPSYQGIRLLPSATHSSSQSATRIQAALV
uniref:Uncharacterized protein n=1 Tax=Cryptomonas curvata TaxID=233186 RepID=A0A7S0M324_9CRYP|mmetsp:Transcript_1979/g.4037  ORF Transcript_1979/g.4037 Transcript_1979/m.4037 type:complete len:112 (+) Transcript_1979:3-338(+)